jgi:hypothetical protein
VTVYLAEELHDNKRGGGKGVVHISQVLCIREYYPHLRRMAYMEGIYHRTTHQRLRMRRTTRESRYPRHRSI